VIDFSKYFESIEPASFVKAKGRVVELVGLVIKAAIPRVWTGELCFIHTPHKDKPIKAEVIGFKDEYALLMPLGDVYGIAPGSEVIPTGKSMTVKVGEALLGRVLNGLGEPIDTHEKGTLELTEEYPVHGYPPSPLKRRRVLKTISVGLRVIDGLLTCGEGQRIGLFAAAGVGKSTLIGMIARNTEADVNVIALVGERGREVRDFLEEALGDTGLKRSVVVVATSDQPALIRLKCAYVATAIAEYFRDKGKKVMMLMDSVTRFARAQREVGLAVGEPPARQGYTPSVFSVLPMLLERTGNSDKGSITAFYTVLVAGDDMNEPIADEVRGILDGHIVLSRNLAAKGHYPAIDVLRSVSRVMNNVVDEQHIRAANKMRELMAVYEKAEDMIRLGAYKPGSDKNVDEAVKKIDEINKFLQQDVNECVTLEEIREKLVKMF
jgi:flagellar protein export ATPase FliI